MRIPTVAAVGTCLLACLTQAHELITPEKAVKDIKKKEYVCTTNSQIHKPFL